MQFLHPAFLVGLVAASIPILLHFLNRRRLLDIDFAPLRFLQPTQERQMRRLNLRRLLLLFIRVAIVTMVVLALAKPTLTGGLASLVPSGRGISALILVDDSASMQAQTSDGTVFDRARENAVQIAQELGSNDEVAVGLFSDHVKPLFGEFVRDPGLVLAELEAASPGYRATDYAAAMNGALDLMGRSRSQNREVYLISDFQVTPRDSSAIARVLERLDQGFPTNIFLRWVQPEPFINRMVEDVQRPATLLRSGETAELAVITRQDGDEPQPVQLFLGVEANAVGETELILPANGSRLHNFPITLPDAGDLSGLARLRPDRYPPDDQRFFVLSVSHRIPVLVLRGLGNLEGERDPLLFLRAALDPAGGGEGDFELEVADAERMDVESLLSTRVVVASDLRNLGAARLSALTDYLEDGGTLLLFTGDPRVRAYTNEKLLPGWTDARLGSFRGEEETYERLEVVAREHPVFSGFEDEEIATLEEVKLRNFFRLPEEIGRPLLRYRDGGAAVSEYEVGEGHIILCGFHTSVAAGDLPFSPMFLPLVQRLTGYLATASWGRFGRQYEVGSALVTEAPVDLRPESRIQVTSPDGAVHPALLDASASPPRISVDEAEQPGIYRFEMDGEPWAHAAVNVPTPESYREFMEADEFRKWLAGDDAIGFRSLEGEVVDAVRTARSGRGIHRLFLVLAGLLLIAESILSRRVAPAAAEASPEG